MKKLLIVLCMLLLIKTFVICQEIDSVWGLKFGEDIVKIHNIIVDRENIHDEFSQKLDTNFYFHYYSSTFVFGGLLFDNVEIQHFNGKFCYISFGSFLNTLENINEFITLLKNKHGNFDKSFKDKSKENIKIWNKGIKVTISYNKKKKTYFIYVEYKTPQYDKLIKLKQNKVFNEL